MNSKEFAEYVKTLKVESEEELRSYDVPALFTSVPIDKAMDIIRKRLREDVTLPNSTPLSHDDVTSILEKSLKGRISSTEANTTSRSMWRLWDPLSR